MTLKPIDFPFGKLEERHASGVLPADRLTRVENFRVDEDGILNKRLGYEAVTLSVLDTAQSGESNLDNVRGARRVYSQQGRIRILSEGGCHEVDQNNKVRFLSQCPTIGIDFVKTIKSDGKGSLEQARCCVVGDSLVVAWIEEEADDSTGADEYNIYAAVYSTSGVAITDPVVVGTADRASTAKGHIQLIPSGDGERALLFEFLQTEILRYSVNVSDHVTQGTAWSSSTQVASQDNTEDLRHGFAIKEPDSVNYYVAYADDDTTQQDVTVRRFNDGDTQIGTVTYEADNPGSQEDINGMCAGFVSLEIDKLLFFASYSNPGSNSDVQTKTIRRDLTSPDQERITNRLSFDEEMDIGVAASFRGRRENDMQLCALFKDGSASFSHGSVLRYEALFDRAQRDQMVAGITAFTNKDKAFIACCATIQAPVQQRRGYLIRYDDTPDFNEFGNVSSIEASFLSGRALEDANRSSVYVQFLGQGKYIYCSVTASQVTDDLTNVFNRPQLSLVQFAADSLDKSSFAQIDGLVYYACGGAVSISDASGITELGLAPASIEAPESNNGSTAQNETYSYASVGEWYDSNGDRHQGEPFLTPGLLYDTFTPGLQGVTGSSAFGSDMMVSPTSKEVRVPTLASSSFKNGLTENVPRVAIYRTENNGLIYYRRDDIDGWEDESQNNLYPSGSIAMFFYRAGATGELAYDAKDSTDLDKHEQLYTNGGELDNVIPPPSKYIATHKNRLWYLDAEDEGRVGYSKFKIDGIGLAWNEILSVRVDHLGKTVAMASQDNRMVVLTEQGLTSFYGEGPDANGNGQFDGPIDITSGIGCIEARSLVKDADGNVYFHSGRGIELLPRGADSTIWISEPLQEILKEFPEIVSAQHDISRTELKFVCRKELKPPGEPVLWVHSDNPDDLFDTSSSPEYLHLTNRGSFGGRLYSRHGNRPTTDHSTHPEGPIPDYESNSGFRATEFLPSKFNFLHGATDWTIGIPANLASGGSTRRFVDTEDGGGDGLMLILNGSLGFSVFINGTLELSHTLSAGQNRIILVKTEGEPIELSLYINGVLVDSEVSVVNSSNDASFTLSMGEAADGANLVTDDYPELVIYNSALGTEDIQKLDTYLDRWKFDGSETRERFRTRTLVYDYRTRSWFVDKLANELHAIDSVMHEGRYHLLKHTDNKETMEQPLYVESLASYDDFGTFVEGVIETGDIHFQSMSGYDRLSWVVIAGEFKGECELKIEESHDRGLTYPDSQSWDLTTTDYSVGQQVRKKYHVVVQKETDVRFRISVLQRSGGVVNSAGVSLHGLTLFASVHPDGPRLRDADVG